MAPFLGAHADGALLQPALQVVDEGADAGIALGRLLAQGLGGHGLQVAAGARRVGRAAGALLALLRVAAGRVREPHRFRMQHCMLELGAAAALAAKGQLAAGQLVEHDAEGIDVGRHADGAAGDLFGGRIGRCQAPARDQRQLAVGLHARVVEQAGDAEVQQLGAATLVQHHVAGLEIAVDDQLSMRMLDGARHFDEQLDARGQRQGVVARMGAQRLAGHVFQHQEGAAVLLAGVQQPGDAGMGEAAEHGALAGEAGRQARAGEVVAQQLDGGLALVEAVGAFGAPDLAHAAFAQQLGQAPGAEAVAGPGPPVAGAL